MLDTIVTVFFVYITASGTELTRIGPLADPSGCMAFGHEIRESIEDGFDRYAPYGITLDRWHVGGGAIYRISDYEIGCVSSTVNITTGEDPRDEYFWVSRD
jgi:hypothetical protein